MAVQAPALDFLRKVQVWQEDEANKTAGLVVVMPDREDETLDGLLRSFGSLGATSGLENRARMWLVGYREMEDRQRVLTDDQRAELHAITDPVLAAQARQPRQRRRIPRYVYVIVAAVVSLGAGLSIAALLSAANPDNPVQPAAGAPLNPGQQVPAGTTSLDNFRHDWGPFTQLAVDTLHPQTHAPALMLLESGGYYATTWTIPDADPAWSPDLGGHVTSVGVHGTWALITDADGNKWIAGTDQPFVFSSDPGTVIRIGTTGDVLTMPEDHAIAARHHI
jgi:hypothetical protein